MWREGGGGVYKVRQTRSMRVFNVTNIDIVCPVGRNHPYLTQIYSRKQSTHNYTIQYMTSYQLLLWPHILCILTLFFWLHRRHFQICRLSLTPICWLVKTGEGLRYHTLPPYLWPKTKCTNTSLTVTLKNDNLIKYWHKYWFFLGTQNAMGPTDSQEIIHICRYFHVIFLAFFYIFSSLQYKKNISRRGEAKLRSGKNYLSTVFGCVWRWTLLGCGLWV
jgi:hypothetical protein